MPGRTAVRAAAWPASQIAIARRIAASSSGDFDGAQAAQRRSHVVRARGSTDAAASDSACASTAMRPAQAEAGERLDLAGGRVERRRW